MSIVLNFNCPVCGHALDKELQLVVSDLEDGYIDEECEELGDVLTVECERCGRPQLFEFEVVTFTQVLRLEPAELGVCAQT